MATSGNWHCANCTGTFSFPMGRCHTDGRTSRKHNDAQAHGMSAGGMKTFSESYARNNARCT